MKDWLEGLWLKAQALVMTFKNWLGRQVAKVWKGGGDWLCESATLQAVKLHGACAAGASTEDARKSVLESISNVLSPAQLKLMRTGEFQRLVGEVLRGGDGERLREVFGIDPKDIANKWQAAVHYYTILDHEDGGYVDATRFWMASRTGLEIFYDTQSKIVSLDAYRATKVWDKAEKAKRREEAKAKANKKAEEAPADSKAEEGAKKASKAKASAKPRAKARKAAAPKKDDADKAAS